MLLNRKEEGFNKKDKLKFEGEYINEDRNGKGKEYKYYTGRLLYEGEYLNGKKWNGKEYDYNCNFVCEIRNGKGNIKEYNYYTGRLIYEGEYLNVKRKIKRKEYNDCIGKLEFEGEN